MGTKLSKSRKLSVAIVAAVALAGGGIAYASNNSGPGSGSGTMFSMAAHFEDYGIDFATTGASQIMGDTGNGSDCGYMNQSSSTAILSAPFNARPVKALLYWVGMEKNEGRNYGNVTQVSDVARFTPFGGSPVNVTAQRRMVAHGDFNGDVQYGGFAADVTSLLPSLVTGAYTVGISGGIPGLCARQGENARAWQLMVVYDTPGTDFNVVNVYDGLEFLSHSTRSIRIDGYNARVNSPSKLTAFVVQGDSDLAGEFAKTSDQSFPDFPVDFARESVNGGAVGANGQAVDIATMTGNLTPGSTSMNLDFGTNQDVIVAASFALKLASVPTTPPAPTTTTEAPTATTVDPSGPTTIAPSGPTTVDPSGPTTVAPSGPTTIPSDVLPVDLLDPILPDQLGGIPSQGACGDANAAVYVKLTATGNDNDPGQKVALSTAGQPYYAVYVRDPIALTFQIIQLSKSITGIPSASDDPVAYSGVVGGFGAVNPVWNFPVVQGTSSPVLRTPGGGFSSFAICAYTSGYPTPVGPAT